MKPTFSHYCLNILISHVKMMSVTKTLSAFLFVFKTQVSAEKKCFRSSLKIWLSLNEFFPLVFVL